MRGRRGASRAEKSAPPFIFASHFSRLLAYDTYWILSGYSAFSTVSPLCDDLERGEETYSERQTLGRF